MTTVYNCKKCGAVRTEARLSGLCPECVIQFTLAPLTNSARDSWSASESNEPELISREGERSVPAAGPRYLGDFQILDLISEGGMGVVFRARQISLNRLVAVKMIRAGLLASDAEVQRFSAEAETAALLDHPNIVPIYEVGEDAGRHYFAMKLIEGGSLADKIRGRNHRQTRETAGNGHSHAAKDSRSIIPPSAETSNGPAPFGFGAREGAALLARVARAIHYAHQRGVLHRDLKPANILLDAHLEPHVSDFGTAKLLATEGRLTVTGVVLGTPNYMSPEAAAGNSKDLTTAADIYSLGAILYEMLTGDPPFRGETALATMRQVIHEEPSRPSTINRQADPDLETICLKCLEKEPGARYRSAEALAEDLERWLQGEPIHARLATRGERLTKWVKRHPVRAAGLVAFFLVLALGIAGISWQWRRASQKAEESRQRLIRMNVAAGVRYVQSADPSFALPWFVEALRLDNEDARRNLAHRTRIAAVLRQAPLLAQMWVHDGNVNQAQFDARGRCVVTMSEDKTARLWDPRTGNALTPPLMHPANVVRAWLTSDGNHIVTACEEGTICFWDARTGKALATLAPHEPPADSRDCMLAVDYHPALDLLAIAVNSSEVRLRRLMAGEDAGILLGQGQQRVRSVSFNADGSRLLTACLDGAARIWDLSTGKLIGQPMRLGQQLYSAAFSPVGNRLVVTGEEGTAQLWDGATCQPVGAAMQHSARIAHMEFSADGARLATASLDSTARVWDTYNGQPVSPPMQHAQTVRWAAFSPDARWLVTACEDHAARVWDAVTGVQLFMPLWHGNVVTCARFSPTGNRVLTSSDDGAARLWDLKGNVAAPVSLAGTATLTSALFASAHKYLITADTNAEARVWDIHGNPVSPTLAGRQRIQCVALSPDAARLLTGSADGHAQVWDISDGRVIATFKHQEAIRTVAWRADGRAVISASAGLVEAAQIWDPQSGKALCPPLIHNHHITCAEFSPDGQRVMTGSNDRTAWIWDARTGRRLAGPLEHASPLTSVHFSPDGHCAATAAIDNAARLWDAVTGRLLTPLLRHGNWVTGTSFSPDGKWLMTASDDGTARVWEVGTGAPVTGPLWLGGGVGHVLFSRDGLRVLAANEYRAQVWDTSSGAPLTPWLDPHGEVLDVCFGDDEKNVLMVTGDRKIFSWDITPLDWPLADLETAAEMVTTRKLDATGALVPLDQAHDRERADASATGLLHLQKDWLRLKANHPGQLGKP